MSEPTLSNLTSSHLPLTAAADLLTVNLPSRFTVTTDQGEPTVGSVTVTVITSPRPIVVTPLVGADKTRMRVQVTVCDSTPTACRLTGDHIRGVLTGTTRRGALLTPITVDGYTFDPPTSLGDGHGATGNVVHTWAETYELVWQTR